MAVAGMPKYEYPAHIYETKIATSPAKTERKDESQVKESDSSSSEEEEDGIDILSN